MYGEVIVAISDAQFRTGVVATALVMTIGITVLRFCGGVSIPPKPPPPTPSGPAGALVARGAATPAVYVELLAKDATSAGVRTPTLADMQKVFTHRSDTQRRVLEVGQPAVEVAGVSLLAVKVAGALVLEVTNKSNTDLAYLVQSQPIPTVSGCAQARAEPVNAMVVAKDATERRVECSWREGMSLVISRVETVEVSPLSAWYLGLVPPRIVGVEERIARAHLPPSTREKCSILLPQAVKTGLERGEIVWRDLVDFFARHRCQTYRFPSSYRAVTRDGEQPIPVAAASM